MTDEERRKSQNDEVLAKFRRGQSLAIVDQQATWWPPRPIIKKNAADMARLYADNNDIKKDEP